MARFLPKQQPSHGHVPGWDTASQCQAGLRQGADSGIYGVRLEAVLGIAPLPSTSLFTQQDVAFRRVAQVMPRKTGRFSGRGG